MALMRYPGSFCSLLAVGLCMAAPAAAEVKLPAIFGSGMVLQRNQPIAVWGRADAAEAVTVTLGAQSRQTTTAADGNWKVQLEPLASGEELELRVTGKNSITLTNIVMGEVWLASGQSNMNYSVSGTTGAGQALARAADTRLRLFTVERSSAYEPQWAGNGRWSLATPANVSRFSAVAYFFGRELREHLQVPVGIIHCSVSGSPAQAWVSRESLAAQEDLYKRFVESADKVAAAYQQQVASYKTDTLPAWNRAVEDARAKGTPLPAEPAAPKPTFPNGYPSHFYNAMIHPLIPFGLAGFIWYQGESNAGDFKLYQKLFPTLIQDWRSAWQRPLPFGFVQLANLGEQQLQPDEGGWAYIRDVQRKTLKVPATGMAVASDTGHSYNLHPPEKAELGRRLSLWARATVYGQKVAYTGPVYQGQVVEGSSIRLNFGPDTQELMAVDNSRRFAEELLPRERGPYINLELLRSAGLLEGAPQPFAANALLTREQAARLVAHLNRKLQEAGDQNLDKTVLPAGVQRERLKMALSNLNLILGPQIRRLTTPWQGELQGFAIAGEDEKFVWAQATIEGSTVVVSSPLVPKPTKVRYNWAGNPVGNLYNKAGLPASGFDSRTPFS